jgi:rubrerythrin
MTEADGIVYITTNDIKDVKTFDITPDTTGDINDDSQEDGTPIHDGTPEREKYTYTYTYKYDAKRIKKYNTTWRTKEKNKEYHKNYYEKNRLKFTEKHICEICGHNFTTGSKYQHLKSKKHLHAVIHMNSYPTTGEI